MQLFYTPDISSDIYTLTSEESRHAVQVLRLGVGESIMLIDGRGGLYKAQIVEASTKACVVRIVEHTAEYGRKPYSLHIAIAPTKNIDRFEWFLEKATEIGLDCVTPLLCERSERKVVKIDRCEKIVLSAAKQSIKAYVPTIEPLTKFSEFIKHDSGDYQKYIAHCDTDFERTELNSIDLTAKKCLILIGAEGDFSPHEIELAQKGGFRGVSLGTSRLRTETAAIMAAATVALKN